VSDKPKLNKKKKKREINIDLEKEVIHDSTLEKGFD